MPKPVWRVDKADVLTAEEMIAVQEFIKSTWPDDVCAIQWQQTAREQSK